MSSVRNRYEVGSAIGLIVDVQDRLVRHIHDNQNVIRRTELLLRGFTILGIPHLFTEQYPSGLGRTHPVLSDRLQDAQKFEKMEFSCMANDGFRHALEATERQSLLIAGIEAHVCVQQTALDALRDGYLVTVVADTIGSRSPIDRETALEHMRYEGVRISTVESVLFELCRVAGTETFKQLSRLLK